LLLAVTGAFHILRKNLVGEAALLPSLVAFGLIETMILDTAFMSSWVVVVFAMATVTRFPVRET
jgi:hypothetical protein